jgi:hypothetical protein
MIKKRIKNHWDGLISFENLVNLYNIEPDGFNANFISIDRIKSIQEFIFQVKKLLSNNIEINDDLDIDGLANELQHLIGYIVDIQDDFQMHSEDLKSSFKTFLITYQKSKEKNILIEEAKIYENNDNYSNNYYEAPSEVDDIDSSSIEDEPVKIDLNVIIPNLPAEIEKKDWKFHAKKLCCEGFNLAYLNEKNKNLFFKIFFRLKNSPNVVFHEDKTVDEHRIYASLTNNPTFEEVGYLMEMRKFGLSIKIAN